MPYIYLFSCVLLSASSTVFGKMFTGKNATQKDAGAFYNLLMLLSVFAGWGVLYAADFSFDAKVLWYSALFAAFYTMAMIGTIYALKYGPAALTSLFIGLSLIVTTVWGFLFWGAKVTPLVIVGVILVVCSITLCLYTKEKDETKISAKWLVFVALAFFGNAGCSITQRTQQMQCNGQHGSMMMLFAAGISTLVCLVMYLRSDRSDARQMLKTAWWIPACAGICNVVLNLFVILMATTRLSPSLIYPTIGVGGLAVVTVFSLAVFKEKMRWWQWLGVAIGAAAVVVLSI